MPLVFTFFSTVSPKQLSYGQTVNIAKQYISLQQERDNCVSFINLSDGKNGICSNPQCL